MAKRRLSKQQQRRISDQQKNKLENDTSIDQSNTLTAHVISHHGRQLFAETSATDTNQTERIKCKIRQNLGDIACGDYVLVQRNIIGNSDTQKGSGEKQHVKKGQVEKTHARIENVVVAVKERKNLLTKTGFAGAIKPVAANIDQLLIVTSLKPKPNSYLIDRYLTAAENLPADAIIVINKIDLMDDATKKVVDKLSKIYKDIGYRVIQTSIKQNIGLDELSDTLNNNTSILVGLSGVGKSSIVKAILPKIEIKIGETSKASGEGKHTTTVSAFYHLKDNGIIIDSPGVRDFTPTHSSIEEITHGFIDVRKFSGLCKFSNCTHHNEPECAMKQAVIDGELNEIRLNNYLRLVDEFNNPD